MRIALDGPALVGFVAATSTRIHQLYVRVGSQRRGVGTALLDRVKVGDKVKFRAEKAGSSYVVTAIEPAK